MIVENKQGQAAAQARCFCQTRGFASPALFVKSRRFRITTEVTIGGPGQSQPKERLPRTETSLELIIPRDAPLSWLRPYDDDNDIDNELEPSSLQAVGVALISADCVYRMLHRHRTRSGARFTQVTRQHYAAAKSNAKTRKPVFFVRCSAARLGFRVSG